MQVGCPHCRQAVTIGAQQAGQQVACPHCQAAFVAPGPPRVATPVTPTPVMPSSPPPELQPSVVTEGSRRRPVFRPRQYPMLFAVMIFFYVLAGLAVVSLVLWLVSIWSAVGALSSQTDAEQFGMALGLSSFTASIMSLSLITGHAMWAAVCVLTAELVKLGLDIQANTQETAHNTRYRN